MYGVANGRYRIVVQCVATLSVAACRSFVSLCGCDCDVELIVADLAQANCNCRGCSVIKWRAKPNGQGSVARLVNGMFCGNCCTPGLSV